MQPLRRGAMPPRHVGSDCEAACIRQLPRSIKLMTLTYQHHYSQFQSFRPAVPGGETRKRSVSAAPLPTNATHPCSMTHEPTPGATSQGAAAQLFPRWRRLPQRPQEAVASTRKIAMPLEELLLPTARKSSSKGHLKLLNLAESSEYNCARPAVEGDLAPSDPARARPPARSS